MSFPPPHAPAAATWWFVDRLLFSTLHYHHHHQPVAVACYPSRLWLLRRTPSGAITTIGMRKASNALVVAANKPLLYVVNGTKSSLLLKKIKCRHARSSGCGSVRQQNRSKSAALEFGAEFSFLVQKKMHAGGLSDASFIASSATANFSFDAKVNARTQTGRALRDAQNWTKFRRQRQRRLQTGSHFDATVEANLRIVQGLAL